MAHQRKPATTSPFCCEACDALLPERGGTLVDGTFGRGGHSRELLRRMPAGARLVAIDRDAAAASAAATIEDPRFHVCRGTLWRAGPVLAGELGIATVDGIRSTSAFLRRSSTTPHGVSVSCAMARSTCEWIRRAASLRPTGSHQQPSLSWRT